MALNMWASSRIRKKMDLALNFIQMEKSDIKGNIKMMNIMVKERKYMKMEITIQDYGMV